MRTKFHFFLKQSQRLLDFLSEFKVEYHIAYDASGRPLYSFDLYDKTTAYSCCKKRFPFYTPIAFTEYSEEDFSSAEWFTVSGCSRRVKLSLSDDTYTFSCPYQSLFFKPPKYRHAVQTGFFAAEQVVRWKSSYFSGSDTADNLLFCSDRGMQLLGEAWGGLEFWPVLSDKTHCKMKDLNQLKFVHVLPEGSIHLKGTEKLLKCRQCGKIRYYIPQNYQLSLHKNADLDKDCVFTTGDIWCYDKFGHAISQYVVSDRFYRTCKQKGISRGLAFAPVELV